jgi:hypothetical protein
MHFAIRTINGILQAEIGRYIKACTENIARLDRGIPSPEQIAAGKGGMNASTMAHSHGVVSQAARDLQSVLKVFRARYGSMLAAMSGKHLCV